MKTAQIIEVKFWRRNFYQI